MSPRGSDAPSRRFHRSESTPKSTWYVYDRYFCRTSPRWQTLPWQDVPGVFFCVYICMYAESCVNRGRPNVRRWTVQRPKKVLMFCSAESGHPTISCITCMFLPYLLSAVTRQRGAAPRRSRCSAACNPGPMDMRHSHIVRTTRSLTNSGVLHSLIVTVLGMERLCLARHGACLSRSQLLCIRELSMIRLFAFCK